jgi:hypothetical protein
MLEEDFQKRYTLVELLQQLAERDPVAKKNREMVGLREMVSSRMARSKEKKKSLPKENFIENAINFERGTFGGYREEANDTSINSSASFGQNPQTPNNPSPSTNHKLLQTESADDDP